MSELPCFFVFTFRACDKSPQVKTSTMQDLEAAKALTEKTGNCFEVDCFQCG